MPSDLANVTPDLIPAALVAADQIDAHWRDAVVIGVVLDDEDAAAIRAVCDALQRERETVRRLAQDWADDDTAIREDCRAVLGDVVDGDPDYRPPMAELCVMVCNECVLVRDELTAARERIAELESRGKPINWPFVDKPKPADGTLRC